MRILLSNDDGIDAVGLRALYTALSEAGHTVLAVAPATEQSAAGCRITIQDPLRFKTVRDGAFTGTAVSGTPADCVLVGMGLLYAAPELRPDLVVAGINAGHNIGFDVPYSGTVAAARQGALFGVPGLAVSRWLHPADDPAGVARHAAAFISATDWSAVPATRTLNLNYPPCPVSELREIRVCPLSSTPWNVSYTQRDDTRGRPYLWLNSLPCDYAHARDAEATDCMLLREKYVTLTPLLADATERAALAGLAEHLPA